MQKRIHNHLQNFKGFLGTVMRFSIYHFIPMVSTTMVIISILLGGLTLKIVLDYILIVLLSCVLLAIATITGK